MYFTPGTDILMPRGEAAPPNSRASVCVLSALTYLYRYSSTTATPREILTRAAPAASTLQGFHREIVMFERAKYVCLCATPGGLWPSVVVSANYP